MSKSDKQGLNFNLLITTIQQVHNHFAVQAGKAVNISLTLRNWAIGCYIREYEQSGGDRAQYGRKLLENLGKSLQGGLDKCYTGRYLRLCRQIYEVYPQIRKSLISKLETSDKWKSPISVLPEHSAKNNTKIVRSETGQLTLSGNKIVQYLSFTMLVELIKIEDSLKRAFYEIESIRGNWSVRELKRQIASLYYERSGLSEDKKKLAEMARSGAEQSESKLAIRDPYIFEFLGIKPHEVMSESDFEGALLDKLQDFLLELGHGFCFEARQKRILIGDTYGFVDLVFYHRILKCHVLIDLKVTDFSHENIGQLNTYVNWYKKNIMSEDDNPPVGLLLCTDKDHALMEYALAGMDNQLFVSKYQLELPSKEAIEKFLEENV